MLSSYWYFFLYIVISFLLLKSETLKKEYNTDTISEIEKLVKTTVLPTFKYSYARMEKGVLQHLDRNYTYDVIPNELINGLLFQGIHRSPLGTTITIELIKPSKIYFFFHNKFDGGYSEIFANLNNWKKSNDAPQYDIYNSSHGLKMIMYEFNAEPGIYKIPPTTKEDACFSIVIQK